MWHGAEHAARWFSASPQHYLVRDQPDYLDAIGEAEAAAIDPRPREGWVSARTERSGRRKLELVCILDLRRG
jgi:hypothetical protein